jgi:hypothetical protein
LRAATRGLEFKYGAPGKATANEQVRSFLESVRVPPYAIEGEAHEMTQVCARSNCKWEGSWVH